MSDRPHALHQGELFVQGRMKSPANLVADLPRYIDPTMPQQHSDFYAGLSYLSVATLDGEGRPWATLLVTKSDDDPHVGISVTGPEKLEILSLNGVEDPFVRALELRTNMLDEGAVLFAGVGVDFSNRRRNKLAGTISSFDMTSQDHLRLSMKSDQHLGNCPKYITLRSLVPYPRVADVALDKFDGFSEPLPEAGKELIAKASTVLLATRHVPDSSESIPAERDMGLNHRGGAPGFVRVYEETNHAANDDGRIGLPENSVTTYLVLPDHSGNRFYQSLGNVQSDPLVGLTFPDFSTGDMLYVTGIAENLFEEEAEELMPRVNLLTRVRITGAVFVKAALQLKMMSDEEYSPYNPPVRYLREELADLRHVHEAAAANEEKIRANLVSITQLSDSVQTFTLELSTPVEATLPGGFAIFDFSEHFDSAYRHMDEVNPQSVNDDHVRTWTISSAARFSAEKNAFEKMKRIDITVKRKDGGAVSRFLHAHRLSTNKDEGQTLSVHFVGNGGAFSCFSQNDTGAPPMVPSRMLWIAGGVGITPFMSMWDGILAVDKELAKNEEHLIADIVLVFAGRDDDLDLLRHFLKQNNANSSRIRISILGFQSLSGNTDLGDAIKKALVRDFPGASMVIEQKRVDKPSLATIEGLSERETFVCGPEEFMRHTQALLESIVGPDLNVHTESYSF